MNLIEEENDVLVRLQTVVRSLRMRESDGSEAAQHCDALIASTQRLIEDNLEWLNAHKESYSDVTR